MTTEVIEAARPAARRLRRKAGEGIGLNSAAGHLVMVLLSLFCLFPVYWMVVTSLRPA